MVTPRSLKLVWLHIHCISPISRRSNMRFLGLAVGWALCIVLFAESSSNAQSQTGNLYGTVTDDHRSVLPGVTVTVAGSGPPKVQASDNQGKFRFMGLSPGSYYLRAELEGFSTVEYSNVTINAGRTAQVEIELSASVEDVITVTSESPLLDFRQTSNSTTFVQAELQRIPAPHDPWFILSWAPGVLLDRANVGGNEGEQQSEYVSPGSTMRQSVWLLDGVVIADAAGPGASPAYYDLDSFEEIKITIGGADATLDSGGLVLNLVTKHGTNQWRGSAHYGLADDAQQADLKIARSDFGHDFDGAGPSVDQPPFEDGNRIISIKESGFELGGPIRKDRLWLWGSYGLQKLDFRTVPSLPESPDGVKDFTKLETGGLKLDAQLTETDSATAFVMNTDKVKAGRNAGPTHPEETTWNQSNFGDSPTAWKLEYTHSFASSLYLTGLSSAVNGGHQLTPQGGLHSTAFLDGSAVWHNTFTFDQRGRQQKQLKVDASTFLSAWGINHDLRFGADFRKAETSSFSYWAGGGFIYDATIFGSTTNILALNRPAFLSVKQEHRSAYLQDTLSVGSLTANVGLRYDAQEAENRAASVQTNPLRPDILPGTSYDGSDPTPQWQAMTPRLGLTYSLGVDKKTLLRTAYSLFADRLTPEAAAWLNPLAHQSYAYFYTNTRGPAVNAGDVLAGPLFYSSNVNPNGGGILQSNAIDSGLSSPRTNELLIGIEHAIRPEFVIGLTLTHRRITEVLEKELLVFDSPDPYCSLCLNSIGRRHRRSDYEVRTTTVTLPNGQSREVTYYQLRPGVSTRLGELLENSEREQQYSSASISLDKRLANGWMLHGSFALSDWQWSKIPDRDLEDQTQLAGGGQREGDPVLQSSDNAPDLTNVYINSRWSYNLTGLYQVAANRPWGFSVALSLHGRQGYPIPYFARATLPSNMQFARLFVQATDRPASFRLDDLHILDARLEKEFSVGDRRVTFDVDFFNLTNSAAALQRQSRLGIPASNHILEVVSPRMVRFGARVNFD